MRFAIPNPPRKVSLSQVPGALKRLLMVCALAVALAASLGLLGRIATGQLSTERAFFDGAEEVPGTVSAIQLPPKDQRDGATAKLDVLYSFGKKERVGSGLVTFAEYAEGLGRGASVTLLVNPGEPDAPREARYAREKAQVLDLVPPALLLGALLALGLVALEVRRTVRADLTPLRQGLLVWLTPDGELPPTRDEVVFAASYFRQDVRFEVKARVRPGRAPVRNGAKVLAAVVPSRPTWVRVIDEDLAKTLGWVQ
ncbi:MAG: DUF3592 domain-containing protein [Myxococcaceae bacterium]